MKDFKLIPKHKAYLSVVVLLLILFVVYKLAFQKTWETKRQCETYQKQINRGSQIDTRLELLSTQLNKVNAKTQDFVVSNKEPHEMVLAVVSEYCMSHKVKLFQFPRTEIEEVKGHAIGTFYFEVTGSFEQLLKLLYLLENETIVTKITSVDFYKKKNKVTKKEQLYLRVYCQNIIKNES